MPSQWWVAIAYDISPLFLVSWVFWIIFSICLHELGHGWAALRSGDSTPADSGHMTWSPLVHMGPMALIIFAILGFTWGAMPINPSRFRGRYDEAKVAFAGPAMNLGLILSCAFLIALWAKVASSTGSIPDKLVDNVFLFLNVGVMLNCVLFLFNLIPIPPLDGSRILANFLPAYRDFIYTERGALAGFIAFGILFLMGGRYIWPFAMSLGDWITTHAVNAVMGGRVLP